MVIIYIANGFWPNSVHLRRMNRILIPPVPCEFPNRPKTLLQSLHSFFLLTYQKPGDSSSGQNKKILCLDRIPTNLYNGN